MRNFPIRLWRDARRRRKIFLYLFVVNGCFSWKGRLSFQNWASSNTQGIFQTWHKWLGVCLVNLQSIPANSIFFKKIKLPFKIVRGLFTSCFRTDVYSGYGVWWRNFVWSLRYYDDGGGENVTQKVTLRVLWNFSVIFPTYSVCQL